MANAFKETVNAFRKEGLSSDEILKRLEDLSDFFLVDNNSNLGYDESKIRKVLTRLCMPTHLEGYEYWVDILLTHKNDRNVRIKTICHEIAEKYNIDYSRVGPVLRYAIEVSFERCPKRIKDDIFGKNISARTGLPTSKQFLIVLSRLI